MDGNRDRFDAKDLVDKEIDHIRAAGSYSHTRVLK